VNIVLVLRAVLRCQVSRWWKCECCCRDWPVRFFLAEKLYNSKGRELRRALFSLKQIFQVCTFFFLC